VNERVVVIIVKLKNTHHKTIRRRKVVVDRSASVVSAACSMLVVRRQRKPIAGSPTYMYVFTARRCRRTMKHAWRRNARATKRAASGRKERVIWCRTARAYGDFRFRQQRPSSGKVTEAKSSESAAKMPRWRQLKERLDAGKSPTLARPAAPLAACVHQHPCTTTVAAR